LTISPFLAQLSAKITKGITMSQQDKINLLQEFRIPAERQKMHEQPTTRVERHFYMSTVGSFLFVGHVTSPIVGRMAGVLASALSEIRLKDIKIMNAAMLKLNGSLPAVAELVYREVGNESYSPFWLIFSDASFHEDVSKIRAEVLITSSFGVKNTSPFHVIDFCSHKLRRLASSTKSAETLAAGHTIVVI
jgi:hypothetical protein